jgi:hypothetical protein
MPLDLADVVLAGDRTIQDLQDLAKSRLTTPRLRVMTLLAAAAYEADEGNVGSEFVERALNAAMRMAKGRGEKPN